MTLDNLNAVADSMRLLNDAARENRISPEEAARACYVLEKLVTELEG